MSKAWIIAGGLGLGAGLMYFYDPEQGKRRRETFAEQTACLKDLSVEKTAEEAGEWFGTVWNGFRSWIQGLREDAGQMSRESGHDEKVVRLGRGRSPVSALPVDTPTARVLTGTAGAGLAFFGLRMGNRTGASLAAMGLTLLASSLAGRDLTT
jgi:hypothetical protein